MPLRKETLKHRENILHTQGELPTSEVRGKCVTTKPACLLANNNGYEWGYEQAWKKEINKKH